MSGQFESSRRDLAFRFTPTPTLVVEAVDLVPAPADAAPATAAHGAQRAGAILDASDSFLQLLGLEREEVVGRGLAEFVHPDDTTVVDRHLTELLDPSQRPQIRVIRPGWGVVWVALAGTAVADQGLAVIALDDITAFRRAEQALAYRASHDPLTGLPNRAVLMSHLGRVLARLRRKPGTVAVLFIDLDGFKNLNDTFGHRLGDTVLKEVARRISLAVRRDDVVTRMGGDEFVVVCDSLESMSESAVIAERIRAALAEPIEAQSRMHQMSASVGVAQTSTGGTAEEDLLRRADLAMYLAKERGRDRVEFFAADLEERLRDRVRLVEVTRTAVADGRIRLAVQPVFRLTDQTVVGYEVFARLLGNDGEVLTPRQFLAVAESSGVIARLDEAVIARTLQWSADKNSDGSGPWVSVNVSQRLLAQNGFPNILLSQVLETGLPPGDVILEISEEGLRSAGPAVLSSLRRLRSAGFRLALDDFGSGLTALSVMRDLAVDFIKIDGSMLSGIGLDAADESIVSAIIDVAHELGFQVIAEGVERPSQADFLRTKGCDLAQGYLYGTPVQVPE